MDKKVLDKFQTLCSRREYCSEDVRRKVLKALDGDESGTNEIMDELLREKYVDDSRYASAFARDKAQISGWGPAKISYQLRCKGIPASVISDALTEIDADKACAKLEKVLEAKYKVLKDDPQWRLKLIRFGLSRGYDYESVSEFLSKL